MAAAALGDLRTVAPQSLTFTDRTTANGLGKNSVSDLSFSEGIVYAATTRGVSKTSDGLASNVPTGRGVSVAAVPEPGSVGLNGLALQAYFDGEPGSVLHLREPSVLKEAWDRTPPNLREPFARERPLLGSLSACSDAALDRLLLVEQLLWQCVNRERYLVYQQAWKAFYRDWQRDRIGEWPTSEPFLQQHHRVCEAVRVHALPPAPLASEVTRSEVFDRGRDRVASLAAATQQELDRVAMPLDAILP